MHAPQIKPHIPPQIKPRMPPQIKPRMPPQIKPCTPPWIKPCTPPLNKTMHASREQPHTPPWEQPHMPPPDRIVDTRFWKYYLAPTSLRAVTRQIPTKTSNKDVNKISDIFSLYLKAGAAIDDYVNFDDGYFSWGEVYEYRFPDVTLYMANMTSQKWLNG